MQGPCNALPGLDREHRALLAQYGEIQKRCSTVIAAQAAEIARLQSQAVRLRAAAMVRETALAWEREDRQAVEAAIPGLPKRLTLARRVEWLMGRVHDLQGAVRQRLGGQKNASASATATTLAAALTASEAAPALHEKSVLCVGQQGAGTTAARRVVEMAGGHFLHHAGDDLQGAAALEASLVAADLVICQTGCVSHDAYWRVQDHCRRTGKQCVLVGQPQAMQFVRSRQGAGASSSPLISLPITPQAENIKPKKTPTL